MHAAHVVFIKMQQQQYFFIDFEKNNFEHLSFKYFAEVRLGNNTILSFIDFQWYAHIVLSVY